MHGLRVLLARHVPGNGLHRAGAVQRNRGDDVLEAGRLHLGQELGHARGFQLEDAGGVAVGDHLVDPRLVQGDVGACEVRPQPVPGHLDGVHDDVQRPKAQEVHLQKAQRLHRAHGELGGDHVVVGLQRAVVHHRLRGDQHPRRVGGGVAGHALQLPGHLDQPVDALVVLVGVAQLGVQLQRPLQGHVQLEGHHLGDGIHLLVAHVHHPAHVPDHRPGGHRAEGDDLGHVVRAVAAAHVVDHLPAPLIVEVAVDIGHAHPLRVQKPLEHQRVLQRVDLGDVQRVGHDGPRAAAPPRPHAHAVGLGVVYKVPHDQEIIHIAHGLDHAQLVFHAVPGVGPVGAVLAQQARLAQLAKVPPVGLALGQREGGQVGGRKVEFHVAAPGDRLGALYGVLEVGEALAHLVLGLDIHLVGVHAHAVLVGQGLARLDAHQHLLGSGVLAGQVVAVVGHHQRNVHLPGQAHQPGVHRPLVRQAVVLQLDEEVVLPEDVDIAPGHLPGFVLPAVQQQLGQVAGQAGRQRDQALAVLLQQRIVHPGPVVIAPYEALADQPGQVLIPLLVLAQQDQVAVVPGGAGLVVHVRADVDLAADHRVDARFLRGAIKIHHAVHHAVVRHRAGSHAQRLQPLHQRLDPACPVQEAVFRM